MGDGYQQFSIPVANDPNAGYSNIPYENGQVQQQPQYASEASHFFSNVNWFQVWLALITIVAAAAFIGTFVWNPINQSAIDKDGTRLDHLESQTQALRRQSQDIVYSAKEHDRLKIQGAAQTLYPFDLTGEHAILTAGGGIVLDGGALTSLYDSVDLLEGDVNTTYGSMRASSFNQIVAMQPYFPEGGSIQAGQAVGPYGGGVALGFATFSQTSFATEIVTTGLATCPLGVGTDKVVTLFTNSANTYLSFRVGLVNTTTRQPVMYSSEVIIDSTGVLGTGSTARAFCQPLQGTTDKFVVAYNKPGNSQGIYVRAVQVTALSPALTATIGALATVINPSDVSCLQVMQNTTGDYFWLAYSSSSDINVLGFSVSASALTVTEGSEVSLGLGDPNSACDIASGVTLTSDSFVVTVGGVGAANIDAKSVVFTQSTTTVTEKTPSSLFYDVTSAFKHETVRLSNTAFAVVYTAKADHKYGEIVTASVAATTYDITFASTVKTYNRWQGDTVTPSGYDPLFSAISVPSSGVTSAQYLIVCFRAPTLLASQEVCQMFHYSSGVYVESGHTEAFTLTYNNDVFGAFAGWDYFVIVAGDEFDVPGDTAMITVGVINTAELSIDYAYTKPAVPWGLALDTCTPTTCPTGTTINVLVRGEWCDGTIWASVTSQGVAYSHGTGAVSNSPDLIGDTRNYIPVPNLFRSHRHCMTVEPGWLVATARTASGLAFSTGAR